ncbi:MAG: DUF2752 domain-containing protein [Bacteroidetes bacterium]|nr:DUF2752 domain-containing protein [Bacteroidota bacterium]MBP6722004.1 DUF2752 domain-containing protein [Bacteroidia bacterium]
MDPIVDWFKNHYLACPYKSFLGIECFGCGMQRSFVALLQGNLAESLALYPALLPMIFTFTCTATHLIFKFRNGANVIKYSFFCTAAIVLIAFGVKVYISNA